MPKLTTVWLWPGSGFADRRWTGDGVGSAEENAFFRTSVRVCASFSEQLVDAAVEARHSEIRFFAQLGTGPELIVDVVERIFEGFECARFTIPPGVHLFSSAQRAELIARAVETAVVRLAALRGWNAQAISAAMQRARESGYRFEWSSQWKSNQKRSWRARLVAEIADDGYARIRVQSQRLPGEATQLSEQVRGGTSHNSLKRAARTMQWLDVDTFAFGTQAHVDSTVGTVNVVTNQLTCEPELVEPLANELDGQYRGEDLPTVTLAAAPELDLGTGYGPTSSRTDAYVAEAYGLHERMENDAQWLAWWKLTGAREVWAPVWFTAPSFKLLVRSAGHRLTATRYRPADTIPLDAEAARQLARSDLLALVERVQKRFTLIEPPPLP